MVDVLANPVAAGLVRRGREWPGPWSDPSQIGGTFIIVEWPMGFIRKVGRVTASAYLRHRPPGFETDIVFAERLCKELREAEDRARRRSDVKADPSSA